MRIFSNHLQMLEPLLIAHRGACAYRPEHTIEAYQLAILQGASVIEPDLVVSKDGILVVRHDTEISCTTNVAELVEFAERKTTKLVDGIQLTGYFVEDFSLKELKQLRAKERLPDIRPGNVKYDMMYEIPTFQEVLDLIKKFNMNGFKVGFCCCLIVDYIQKPSILRTLPH
jgi:glycerophosphoryl diester phosphodiesterase